MVWDRRGNNPQSLYSSGALCRLDFQGHICRSERQIVNDGVVYPCMWGVYGVMVVINGSPLVGEPLPVYFCLGFGSHFLNASEHQDFADHRALRRFYFPSALYNATSNFPQVKFQFRMSCKSSVFFLTPFRLTRISLVFLVPLLVADIALADRSGWFPNSPGRAQVTTTEKK